CERKKKHAHWPRPLRLRPPPGVNCTKLLLRHPQSPATRYFLWRSAGSGLSAIRMRSTSWEFHLIQLSCNSDKTPVAKTAAEGAQPGKALPAGERRLVARTRFFIELGRAVNEHLLLSRRHAERRGLQDSGARAR